MLPLPLSTFVARLRAAGFGVDAGREFQLRRVLHERGSAYIGRFGELKYLLAPYVVRNPGQQRRFYELWDDYVAELEAATAKNVPVKPEEVPSKPSLPEYLIYAAVLSALIFLGPKVWQRLFPALGPDPVRVTAQPVLSLAREGDTAHFLNTTKISRPEDSSAFQWTVTDVGRDSVMHVTGAFDLHYPVPLGSGRSLRIELEGSAVASHDSLARYVYSSPVYCADPPHLEGSQFPGGEPVTGKPYLFSVPVEENTDYWLLINGDTLPWTGTSSITTSRDANSPPTPVSAEPSGSGNLSHQRPGRPKGGVRSSQLTLRHTYTFPTEGNYFVEIKAARRDDPAFCFSTRIENLTVGENLPILPPLALREDAPRQVLGLSSWVYWLLMLFGLYLIGQYRHRWLEDKVAGAPDKQPPKTDEELALAYPIFDQGPYSIPYRDRSGQIKVPSDFFRIADQLRFREEGERRSFDGRATVEATIREGGFPQWRDRAARRPADYLALLTHHDEFNQRDRLLRRLMDFLEEREASLVVYYHSGAFDHFWNEEHPQGYTPAQLHSRYYHHRLLIVGDGHGLIDPFESRHPRLLPARQKWMLGWDRRLVLTTEPAVDWSFQEVLLHRYALLFPLTTNGILTGLETLNETEEYIPGLYPRWERDMQRLHPEPSHRHRLFETLEDHRDYLSGEPDLFRWLCALAVATQPDWNLTIAIGRALGIEVTHDALLTLSRIPWLAENRPDPDLRLALLRELSPSDEAAARRALVTELKAVEKATVGSFAATDWTTETSIQAFLLDPDDPANKQRIEELRRVGWLSGNQLAELDDRSARINAERNGPERNVQNTMTKGGSPSFEEQGIRGRLEPTPEDANPNLTALLDYEEPKEEPAPEPWLNRRRIEALAFTLLFLLALWPVYLYESQGYELAAGEETTWWQRSKVIDDEALDLNNEAVGIWNRTAALGSDSLMRARNDSLVVAVGKLAEAIRLRDGNYPLADSNRLALAYNIAALPLADYYRTVNDVIIRLAPPAYNQRQTAIEETILSITDLSDEVQNLALGKVDTLYGYLRQSLEAQVAATNPYQPANQNTQAGNRPDQATDIREDRVHLAAFYRHFGHLLGLAQLGRYVAYNRFFGASTDHPAAREYETAREWYESIDAATGGRYFDSLSLVAPVNLRSLLIDYAPDTTTRTDLQTQNVIEPEAPPEEYVLRGRVVGPDGNPVSGVAITVSPYGPVTEYSDREGRFRFLSLDPEEAYRINLSVPDLYETSLTYRYDERRGDLGNIVWEPAGAATEREDAQRAVQRVGGLLGSFQRNTGRYDINHVGDAAAASNLQNYLVSHLLSRSETEDVFSARQLLTSLRDRYPGAQVAGSDTNQDNFLFVGAAGPPEEWATPIYDVIRNSEALVIHNATFQDERLDDFVKSAPYAANRIAEGAAVSNALSSANFSVERLDDRTRDNILSSTREFVGRERPANAQVIIYVTGFLAGDYMLTNDASLDGAEAVGLADDFEQLLEGLSDLRHYVVLSNLIELDLDALEQLRTANGNDPPDDLPSGAVPVPDMVSVPGGTFQMGDTFDEGEENEKPVHTVTLSPYQLGRYEVTFDEYDRFCTATNRTLPSDQGWGRGRRPVINVSWYDAISYCNWLSVRLGYTPVYRLGDSKINVQWEASQYGLNINSGSPVVIANWTADGFRLPTEAEWEFAASYKDGKGKARFGNGEDVLRATEANFNAGKNGKEPYSEIGDFRQKTVSVGSLNSPNGLGVHDLCGNVEEWCWDWFDRYAEQSSNNPYGASTGSNRVVRGGSWSGDPIVCRATARYGGRIRYGYGYLGFRLARAPRSASRNR